MFQSVLGRFSLCFLYRYSWSMNDPDSPCSGEFTGLVNFGHVHGKYFRVRRLTSIVINMCCEEAAVCRVCRLLKLSYIVISLVLWLSVNYKLLLLPSN
jgi:hypothetical protein